MLCGVTVVLSGACSSDIPDNVKSDLPAEDQAIYQMLALELRGFRQKNYPAENGICVGVHRTSTSDVSAISPRILQTLESNIISSPKLVPYSPDRCGTETGFGDTPATRKIPWLLYASDVNEHPDWDAGFVCGSLCGWGHLYRVEIEGDEVTVEAIGDWIS
jgi:hypothetical protein